MSMSKIKRNGTSLGDGFYFRLEHLYIINNPLLIDVFFFMYIFDKTI